MEKRIFDDLKELNPNYGPLIIPREEGGTSDDSYLSSIGDATQKHINELAFGDRQLWESCILVANKLIFRTEYNTQWEDPDPMDLEGEDLNKSLNQFLEKIGKDAYEKEEFAHIREIFEMETERRARSEDVYCKSERISYAEFKKNPALCKYADIPKTPKDHLVFMGDCNTLFYDEFPEGHPDSQFIKVALYEKLNRPEDELTDIYLDNFKEWAKRHDCKDYVIQILCQLADNINQAEGEYIQLTKDALTAIDNKWAKEWRQLAKEKSSDDSLKALFSYNLKQWEKMKQNKISPLGSIKKFGQVLFLHYRSQMKKCHWDFYRKIKQKYAPGVFVREHDINRCNMKTLRTIFNIDDNIDRARVIWLNRPYESLKQIKQQGLLNKDIFAETEAVNKILTALEKIADKCKENLNIEPLLSIRLKLVDCQRKKINNIQNWKSIWVYYNLLKDETNEEIKAEKKGKING